MCKRCAKNRLKLKKRISHLEGALVVVMNMIGNLTKAQRATDETVKVLAEKVDALTGRIDTVIEMVIERTLGHENGNKQDGND